jgi:hypothetical protein
MNAALFKEFLASKDTLRVYHDDEMVFSSERGGLRPLLEYLDRFARPGARVVIFDRAEGNAAALLSIEAGAKEVFSPMGSRIGIKTLEEHGVIYHIDKVVDCILQQNLVDMCPMEKLSLGKNSGEFFQAVSKIIKVK